VATSLNTYSATKPALHFILKIVATLFFLYTFVFIAFAIVPVDSARVVLGPNATQDAVTQLRREWGLDEPFLSQFVIALGNMSRGDFGRSFYFNRPAAEIIIEYAPRTIGRAIESLLSGVLIGIFFGGLAGHYSLNKLRGILVLAQSLPSFCVLLFFLWGGVRLFGFSPSSAPVFYEALLIAGASLYPAGIVGTFIADRLVIEVTVPRHVDLLRMLGAPRQRISTILIWEALPGVTAVALNAFGPTLTGISLGELIFSIRGFGPIFFRSCERGDLTVVVAGTLLLAILFLVLQRLGDLIQQGIDTRVRGNE